MPILKDMRFLLAFAVPALLPVGYLIGQMVGMPNLFAFFTLFVLDGLLPVLEWLLGENPSNEDGDETDYERPGRFASLIVMACLPVFAGLLVWAGYILFVVAPFNAIGIFGWTLSLGYIGGFIAINPAHELIHRRSRVQRCFGGALLSLISYSGFKVEHVRGHHVHVSTPEDPSSAERGQSLYTFLPRAVVLNSISAWKLEAARLRQRGLPWFHVRNELIGWHLLTAVIAGAHVWAYGWAGLAFFLGQSLFAIYSLETINYVEHYGLRRRKLPNGRYERPDITHSWNSCHRLSNAMLFNLARHSDHHAHPTRPYPLLRHSDASPQLPAGYGAMFLLATIPPWWKKVMDPRVDAYENAREPLGQ